MATFPLSVPSKFYLCDMYLFITCRIVVEKSDYNMYIINVEPRLFFLNKRILLLKILSYLQKYTYFPLSYIDDGYLTGKIYY